MSFRTFHRKAHKKTNARYLLKCNCCKEKVEIYYDDSFLEINGVIGTTDEWRKVLLPLLAEKK